MSDPYAVMGVPVDATDDQIRRRYLELIKTYSPEHHPSDFARIRAAFEQIKDLDARVRYRLYDAGKEDTIDAIIEELVCQTPRRRISLQELLTATEQTTPR